MKIFFRIIKYSLQYKKALIFALIMSFFFVAANVSSLWLTASFANFIFPSENQGIVKEINETVTNSENMDINKRIKYWTSDFLRSGTKLETLKRLCVLIFITFLIKNFFYYLKGISFGYVRSKAITDIRNEVYRHLTELSMPFYDKKKPGEISSIIVFDISNVRETLSISFDELLVEPINIATMLATLFIINWKLTLAAVLIVPISGYIMQVIGRSIRRKSLRSSRQMAGISSIINETVHGIRIVKAFAMEKFELDKFFKETYKYYKLIYRRVKLRRLSTPINEVFAVGIGVLLLYFGGKSVLSGSSTMTAEDFLRFVLLVFAMMEPIRKLNKVNIQLQQGIAAGQRIFKLMDHPVDVKEVPNPKELESFNSEIKYDNVSFKYETSIEKVLDQINLTIKKGEIVAFVGHSGAGKTTMVDLLPRFYEPMEGQITIDGVNIKELSFKSLRNMMGIVTQNTILFNDTVRNNIAYGMVDTDDEKVLQAAEAANAMEFIKELPEKLDTNVGENGSRLSGGQRQRIAIARAIYKNPAILILDEATSALDSESEAKVQQAIERLMQNRTSLVIAHRLSTVQNANKIIVMDGGKIVETGTHTELLEKGGVYKKLYDTQFAE
ncbi:MAG: ABC transporter ATP-binding protein [Candidatus Marinimicrobia bacterium]|nr:ABC transporter ATP-binding protein [Candidatus Neomarinimicrobiota bacterium]